MSQAPDWPPPMTGGPGGQSGAVTAVSIVGFCVGGLAIICGFLGMIGGAWLSSVGTAAGSGEAQALGAGAILHSLLILALGAALIASGVGVLQRKSWGRIVALVCAGVCGLEVILSIFGGVLSFR